MLHWPIWVSSLLMFDGIDWLSGLIYRWLGCRIIWSKSKTHWSGVGCFCFFKLTQVKCGVFQVIMSNVWIWRSEHYLKLYHSLTMDLIVVDEEHIYQQACWNVKWSCCHYGRLLSKRLINGVWGHCVRYGFPLWLPFTHTSQAAAFTHLCPAEHTHFACH